ESYGDAPGAMTPEAVRTALPPSIREVLHQRLAGLPDEVLQLLQVAAVAGRDFRLSVVARVCGLDEDAALDVMAAPLGQALVEEAPERIGHYRFVHALVRDTLYA